MNKIDTPDPQSGNALVYILIAVVLFAALSFAVSNMMRGGADSGNEKAGILVSEMLSYAASVRGAVQTMRISKNCSDTQISFERAPFNGSDTAYINPAAPTDFSCHVFHPNGGGAAYMTPPDGVNEGSSWYFTGRHPIHQLGGETPNVSELLMMLEGVDTKICRMINTRRGLQEILTENQTVSANTAANAFKGSYITATQIGNAPPFNIRNIMSGCFGNAPSGKNYFFQVLVVR